MKTAKILFAFALLSMITISCDKVTNPIKPAVDLDTNLFPGNWAADYPVITWTANPNTDRNVLIEDYTGHRCPNCPAAATIASDLETADPTRIFVASLHAAPGGTSSFQDTSPDCGEPSNPEDKYCTEFFNDVVIAYGTEFQSGFGFFANPQGAVSREVPDGSSMFSLSSQWGTRANDLIAANDLKINIQSQINYYPSTNGLFLHTETEMLEDLGNSYNLVVYLIEDKVTDWQDDNGTALEDYKHHNVLRGCIDGLPWGRTLNGTTSGSKNYLDYTYELPAGKTNDDYHLLIYAYDQSTYEILQVIKQDF
ncbi:MAG: hypothetical protein ACI857_001372 [Arenicella sp.]|jgi:hypothetical protein